MSLDREGNYLFDLSRKGEGPDEYESIENMYEENGYIYLYDNSLKKLLCFDIDGRCVDVKKVTRQPNAPSPVSIHSLDNGRFLSLNSFSGEDVRRPVFSVWNKELDKQQTLGGRSVLAGFRFPDVYYISENQRVLYWEPVKDTLFAVINQQINPLYHIGFGAYSLPASVEELDV